MRTRLPVCTALLALAAAPPAAAHVTVNPREAPAESFTRFAVRVPTERQNADTTKVTVRLPEGLFFVSFQPKPGWRRSVKMEKLRKPVELFGDEVTERVAQVTWSGGRIRPNEFDEFGMSARMPERAGTSLIFPSVQTYSNGEVVRWIGPPDAEEPAPTVKVTAAEEEGAAAPEEQTANEDDDGSDGLARGLGIAGIVVALLALGVTLLRQRKAA